MGRQIKWDKKVNYAKSTVQPLDIVAEISQLHNQIFFYGFIYCVWEQNSISWEIK